MPCFMNGVSAMIVVGPVRYLVTVCVFSMRGRTVAIYGFLSGCQLWLPVWYLVCRDGR